LIKKLKSKAGMTLIEMLASLIIVVLLAVGMNTGMTAGLRVYTEASSDARISALASNINTALTDILRYAEVREVTESGVTKYLITNLEYGLRDAYFGVEDGVIKIYFWTKNGILTGKTKALVNSGYYYTSSSGSGSGNPPDFIVKEFAEIVPVEDERGVYFSIKYKVVNAADETQSREVEAAVRSMSS